MQPTIHIIVVAAGSGSRFGSDLPKQFCMLRDKPVLCHTVERLLAAIPQARIITVLSPSMTDYWKELAAAHGTPEGLIVEGGATRWESVRKALAAIGTRCEGDIVLVHDGARPLVDAGTVKRIIKATRSGSSAVPVVAVTDSLRQIADDGTSTAVDRSCYRAVSTPQGFMLADLRKAYALPYSATFTDDASVMAAAGFTDTLLVDSLPSNIKITHPGDLALASWYLSQES